MPEPHTEEKRGQGDFRNSGRNSVRERKRLRFPEFREKLQKKKVQLRDEGNRVMMNSREM